MTKLQHQLVSLVQSEILNRSAFPSSPFKRHDWSGLVYNRDRYGAAGLPRKIFDAALSRLYAMDADARLLFIPAVFAQGDERLQVSDRICSWADYIGVVGKIDFLPEYFLVTPSLSFLIWADADATVIGADLIFMERLLEQVGGRVAALRRCAADFGVDIDDARSQMAAYVRAVGRWNEENGEALYRKNKNGSGLEI